MIQIETSDGEFNLQQHVKHQGPRHGRLQGGRSAPAAPTSYSSAIDGGWTRLKPVGGIGGHRLRARFGQEGLQGDDVRAVELQLCRAASDLGR